MTSFADTESIVKLADHRWTIGQYHAMIANGILSETDQVELLFGRIIDMSPVGKAHAATLQKITKHLMRRFIDEAFIIGVQDPVTLPNDSEPEPDVYIARGTVEELARKGHPGPAELLLVIEVSDATLSLDRNAKRIAYALAEVQEYWIVNVFEREVEQHLEPQKDGTYGRVLRHGMNASFASTILGDFKVTDLVLA